MLFTKNKKSIPKNKTVTERHSHNETLNPFNLLITIIINLHAADGPAGCGPAGCGPAGCG